MKSLNAALDVKDTSLFSSANLKYKYGYRHFGARLYFADTADRNKKAINAYIISIKEFVDPFTGSKNLKA